MTNDTFTHNGHTVSVGTDFMFVVTGPEFPAPMTCESAREAKAEIDKQVALASREKIRSKEISIPAISETGQRLTIRGINRTTGAFLGHDNKNNDIYPDVPWISEAAQKYAALLNQAQEIFRRLSKYRIQARRGYGRIDVASYDRLTDELLAEAHKKKAEAELAAPQ